MVVVRQSTDWLAANALFSPNVNFKITHSFWDICC